MAKTKGIYIHTIHENSADCHLNRVDSFPPDSAHRHHLSSSSHSHHPISVAHLPRTHPETRDAPADSRTPWAGSQSVSTQPPIQTYPPSLRTPVSGVAARIDPVSETPIPPELPSLCPDPKPATEDEIKSDPIRIDPVDGERWDRNPIGFDPVPMVVVVVVVEELVGEMVSGEFGVGAEEWIRVWVWVGSIRAYDHGGGGGVMSMKMMMVWKNTVIEKVLEKKA